MSIRLKKYLRDLLVLGCVGIVSGIVFLLILLNLSNSQEWNLYYLPLKIIGVIVAYILVSHKSPGGNVNIYFAKHTLNDDEKKLDKLLIKNSSKLLMFLPPSLYLLADWLYGINRYNLNTSPTLDGIFTYLFIPFLAIASTCQGVKYLSAWLSVKRI